MEITFEEICKAFDEHCKKHPYCCCRYRASTKCEMRFTLDYIKQKLLEKVDGKDTNVPTKLPKWCKVGAWVLPFEASKTMLGRIVYIGDDTVGILRWDGTFYTIPLDWLVDYCPVKFRAYNFEEAKGLLGKVMEWSYSPEVNRCVSIIHDIEKNGMGVEINGTKQDVIIMNFNATIDGVPFGVPEIDEEAMKKGGEE